MRTLGIFVLLGALLFAIDRASERAARSTAAPAREAAAQDREPTPEEDVRLLAAAARRAGLDRSDPVVRTRLVRNLRFLGHDGSDAALYREALALGMDRSDVVVERRLADRMAAHLRADALRDLPPDEEDLRQWYERNGERWRRSPAVAFTHVFVSRERHGAVAETRARALLASLRADRIDPEDAPARGDPFLLSAHAPLRRAPDLARQFGPAFAAAVLTLAPGAWSDPIESSYGLHLVWVRERRRESRPPFDEVRAQVEDAWREARGEEGLRNALVSLRSGRQ